MWSTHLGLHFKYRDHKVVEEPREVLCAFGGPEGLTTVFGRFEGVEQDKIGGKSCNRGKHAEKRNLNRV